MKHAKEPQLSRAKLAVLGIVILAIGLGAAAFSAGRSSSSQTSSSSTEATTKPPVVDKKDPYSQYRVKGWIAEENAKPGTTEWKIPDDRAMWAKVEGFLDTTSIDVGVDSFGISNWLVRRQRRTVDLEERTSTWSQSTKGSAERSNKDVERSLGAFVNDQRRCDLASRPVPPET